MPNQPLQSTEPRVVLAESAQLLALSPVLKTAGDRLRRQAWDTSAPEAQHIGRLIEALRVAEDALFNAVNVASSYLDCEAAESAIRASRLCG